MVAAPRPPLRSSPKCLLSRFRDGVAAEWRTAPLNLLFQIWKAEFFIDKQQRTGKQIQTSLHFLLSLSPAFPPLLSARGWGWYLRVFNMLRQLTGWWSHVVKSHHAFHVASGPLLELTHHRLETCHSTLKKRNTTFYYWCDFDIFHSAHAHHYVSSLSWL